MREGGVRYEVDIAIPCLNGTVAITAGDRPAPPYALHNPDVDTVHRAAQRLGGNTVASEFIKTPHKVIAVMPRPLSWGPKRHDRERPS